MGINLLDVDCILTTRENFEVEFNNIRLNMSSDDISDMIHCEKIDFVDLIEDEFAYIKFTNEDCLVIMLDVDAENERLHTN